MSWTHTRSKLANTLKKDPEADVTELRQQLRVERTTEYIRKLVDGAPPLSEDQRAKLAELLAPVRRTAGVSR